MGELDTLQDETHYLRSRPGLEVATGPGTWTQGTMLAGSVISASVGSVLIIGHVHTTAVAGALFGVHMAIQGVLQLLTVHKSKASTTVRWLLSAGGLAVFLLGAALFHGWVDTAFLLGVWTGCGWLLRGFTMAVSGTSPSVSHVFVYDDLLNAVIVSAGLLMTAFPFSSVGQLANVGGCVLTTAGAVEAVAAARRRPRILRAID